VRDFGGTRTNRASTYVKLIDFDRGDELPKGRDEHEGRPFRVGGILAAQEECWENPACDMTRFRVLGIKVSCLTDLVGKRGHKTLCSSLAQGRFPFELPTSEKNPKRGPVKGTGSQSNMEKGMGGKEWYCLV